LGVALVVVVLLVAAALRLVLAAAAAAARRPLLVGSVPRGLGASLHQARAPLGQRGHGSGRSAAPDRQGRGTCRVSLTAPAPGASVLILGAGAMSVGCGAEGSHEEPGLSEAGGPGVGGVLKAAFRPRPSPSGGGGGGGASQYGGAR
uniref:RIKEN cDNA 1810049J17 gene n=1 Tax=Cricetulus griseus TaxID=10029 RepID=A0A8C2LLY1_CRIGR